MSSYSAPPVSQPSDDYDLGNAIAFIGLFVSLVMFVTKFAVSVIQHGSTTGTPFFYVFNVSKIHAIHADWLVFLALLVHIVRTKFGIAFLRYDESYLAAENSLGRRPEVKRLRDLFILFNAGAMIAIPSILMTSWPCWIVALLVLLQALSILAFNWYNREQLFLKDTDRRSNLMVVVGDIGVLLLGLGALVFHLVVGANPSIKAGAGLIVDYFCLFSFGVLELLILLLAGETAFTYRQALNTSWQDLKRVFVSG
jgi:hypothetical protein